MRLVDASILVGEPYGKGKHGFADDRRRHSVSAHRRRGNSDLGRKKIQELHAKEVGVGNPSEERASS